MFRALTLGLGLLLVSAPAWARSEKSMGYSPQSVWSPVVRFVRVDENLTILERDAEAGYILFELREEKKVFRGSVEIIAASPDHGVRVILDIRDRPSYMEIAMLERLERKLIAELGPAPSPPRKPDGKQDGKQDDKGGKSPDGKDDKGGKDGKRPRDQDGKTRDTLPEAPTQPLPEPGASS